MKRNCKIFKMDNVDSEKFDFKNQCKVISFIPNQIESIAEQCFPGCHSLQNISYVKVSLFVSSDFKDSPFNVEKFI
jgi:hypothetical protein